MSVPQPRPRVSAAGLGSVKMKDLALGASTQVLAPRFQTGEHSVTGTALIGSPGERGGPGTRFFVGERWPVSQSESSEENTMAQRIGCVRLHERGIRIAAVRLENVAVPVPCGDGESGCPLVAV